MTKMLIVDDDALFAHMLAERLRREVGEDELVLESTGSAEEAGQRVKDAEEPYDILLIDNRLGPSASGIEVIEALRLQSSGTDFVLFTGYDEPDVGLRAYEAGVYRYLVKPFDPVELIWIIRSLIKHRAIRYERAWLHTLTEVAERAQRANSVREVGKGLVEGGVRFGFRRAWLYRFDRTNPTEPAIQGVAQFGVEQIPDFERRQWPLVEAKYAQKVVDSLDIHYFRGDELGPGLTLDDEGIERFPLPAQEWVGIPLQSEQDRQCLGLLYLDPGEGGVDLNREQRALLHLFMRQAAAAFERAILLEEDKLRNKALDIIERAHQRQADSSKPHNLEGLLIALYEEVKGEIPLENFLVVLGQRGKTWLRYVLDIENGRREESRWRDYQDSGLIAHLVQQGRPLYLPRNVMQYREKNQIRRIGPRAALSWMGAPLSADQEISGAIVLEHDSLRDAFAPDHFRLLQTIAKELSTVLQLAWQKERVEELSRPLQRLQQASYDLMVSVKDEETRMWEALCVLATAPYGFGFDRAMLFLAEESGAILRGAAGIGFFEQKEVEHDRKAGRVHGANFKEYLSRTEPYKLVQTPVGEAVVGLTIQAGINDDAFTQVLRNGKNYLMVKAADVSKRLPSEFLTRFGIADYAIVPLTSVNRTIGLMVVDRSFHIGPTNEDLLSQLDALTNQAAEVYENLRHRVDQEKLIDLTFATFEPDLRTLKQKLDKICEVAQLSIHADRALIYPLKLDTSQYEFDVENIGRVGEDPRFPQAQVPRTSGFTAHLLRSDNPVTLIPNVGKSDLVYNGERLAQHPYLQSEGIQAVIAAHICDPQSGDKRGIFYLDFRTPQNFTEQHERQARKLADLAAMLIDQAYRREAQEAREEELRRLGQVLEGSLFAESNERQVVKLLLDAIPAIFSELPVTTGIALKEWQRAAPDGEPVALHHYFFPEQSPLTEELISEKDDNSISGRAMRTGQVQNIENAPSDPDYKERDQSTLSELDVPVLLDGQVVGVLNIESSRLSAFTKHHEEMGQRFAHVAALTIGNVRRQRNLRTVLEAAQAITAPPDLATTLRQIADGVRQAVPNLSTLTIWYKDPRSGDLALADSYFGVHNEEVLLADHPRRDGMVRYVMTLRDPLWVKDVTQNERFASKKFVELEGIRSTAVFPLRAQDESVGVMFFSYRVPHTFTAEEKRLYPILAEVVAASIQGALLLTQAERERQRFALALDITETIGAELDQEEAIEKVLTRLQQDDLFPSTTAAVLRYDQEEDRLVFTPSSLPFYFPDDPAHPTVPSVSLGERSIAAAVARRSLDTRQKEYINEGNVQGSLDYLPVRTDTQSELAISLWTEDKGLFGVLVLESTQPFAFDDDAVQTTDLLANQVRLALERALERDDMEVNNTVATATAWGTEIAHDIEQEIYHIRSSVEALRDPTVSEQRDRVEQYLTTIDQGAQRLVTATPPKSQKAELLQVDDYLRTIVMSLVEEIDPHIVAEFSFCCEDLEIISYPIALERILRHLMRNASQAMADRTTGKRIWIETERFDERGQIEIRISDNGVGIPPHLQHQIFRRRFSRNGGGNGGLGLMLVYFLVKTIGGSIRPMPLQPKQGATFAIRLPLQLSLNTTTSLEA